MEKMGRCTKDNEVGGVGELKDGRWMGGSREREVPGRRM